MASYFRSCGGKSIANNINKFGTGLHFLLPFFVRREHFTHSADLPALLDLKPQIVTAKSHDSLDRFLQIGLGISHEQQIIHIPQVMLNVVHSFPSAFFVQSLGDEPIKRV